MSQQSNALELIRKAEAAFAERAMVNGIRQEISWQLSPQDAYFTTDSNPGDPWADHIYDPTGAIYARDFSGALSSLLRPAGQRWFRAKGGTGGKIPIRTERVLDRLTNTTLDILMERKAGFSRSAMTMDRYMALFGEAPLCIEDRNDPRDAGIRIKALHPSWIAFEEDQDGEPAIFFHKITLSHRAARQLFLKEAQFGPEYGSVHPDLERLAREKPAEKTTIYRIVMPLDDYEFEYRTPGVKLPYVSVYIDAPRNHVMRERPMRYCPYVIPRWQMVPGQVHGFSPAAMLALPLDRRMQAMYLSVLENANKQADPPIKVSEHAVIGGEMNLMAGGLTVVETEYDERSGKAIEPLFLSGDMRVAMEMIRDARFTMADIFYISKMVMSDAQPKTAYEASIRLQEYVRQNLPIVEPLESECNARVLNKVAEIGMLGGAYGDPAELAAELPAEMRGRELQWQFMNPLRDAIDMNKAVEFQRTIEMTAAAISVDPNAVQAVNITQALTDAVSTTGHHDWLFDEEERAKRIAAMQKAMAEQAELEQMKTAAEAARNAGQAIGAAAPGMQTMEGAGIGL